MARRVLRHRVTRSIVVLVIGVGTALSLSSRVAAIDEERASWGESMRVAVMTDAVAVGDLLDGSYELLEVPTALVGTHPVVEVDRRARAKTPLYAGEVLVRHRVTNTSDAGPPAGTVALTVPVLAQVPLVAVGDLVDLWVVDAANFSSRRAAHRVAVLAFSDDDITVAVPTSQVREATAASLRPVTVTLVG